MQAGTLARWLVTEGSSVSAGQVIALVETDKVTVELGAPASGILLRLAVSNGEVVPVGATIAWIGETGESIPGEVHSDSLFVAGDTSPRGPIPGAHVSRQIIRRTAAFARSHR
jgi:pyruvate/2-oxoglutarate dehydrogenase complex dihydrolipoamide acyltransferase (E2) component